MLKAVVTEDIRGSPPCMQSEIVACQLMNEKRSRDPLHGVTLEQIVTSLADRYGWAELAHRININCFKSDPSVKSSLKYLRKTQWARNKVEALYISSQD